MQTKNKEKTILLFFSLILFSSILMGLDRLEWLNWLKRPVERLVNPVKERAYYNNREIKKLGNEEIEGIKINDLLEKLEKTGIENASLKLKLEDLERENTAMRKLLGAPLSPVWKFIPAKVINVENGIMTVNQGSDAGIKKDEVVIFENVLVGQIIKVNPGLSKIRLIVHKDINIKVKIVNINVKGIVKSEAGNIFLDEILQEVNLTKDQIIVTGGEDEIYPPDLLIGKIDLIEKNETAIFQKAILKPFLDYKMLDTVFVVKI